jgi:hypothetical protein
MTEAERTSETSANFNQTTRRNIPEDRHLQFNSSYLNKTTAAKFLLNCVSASQGGLCSMQLVLSVSVFLFWLTVHIQQSVLKYNFYHFNSPVVFVTPYPRISIVFYTGLTNSLYKFWYFPKMIWKVSECTCVTTPLAEGPWNQHRSTSLQPPPESDNSLERAGYLRVEETQQVISDTAPFWGT